jgi:hypothetical protein
VPERLPSDELYLVSANVEDKLYRLIDTDPARLHQRTADRHGHLPKGKLDLRPPVTTCDGYLKSSPFAKSGFVGVGNPDEDATDGLSAPYTANTDTDRPKKEVLGHFTGKVFHCVPHHLAMPSDRRAHPFRQIDGVLD